MITKDSVRAPASGSGGDGAIGFDGLFSSRSQDPKDGSSSTTSRGGSRGTGRRSTGPPAPPPYANDEPANQRKHQLPMPLSPPPPAEASASAAATARSARNPPPPVYNVPEERTATAVVVEDPAYLFTETFPFTAQQFDREKESLLVRFFVCFCFICSVLQDYGKGA